MITYDLFPTPVSFFEFESTLTEAELNCIKDQETRDNLGNNTSIDNYLFKLPELSRISEFCNTSLLKYYNQIYSPKEQVVPYITQSWANYTNKGQFHHKHEHPNSIISGVFYVQATKDVDKIYFYKSGYERIKTTVKDWNLYNSESWWLAVKTGQLLLFPSHLTHMVETVQTDETRISISFNTFLKGYVGDELSLTALHL